jgi:hypothetical protein
MVKFRPHKSWQRCGNCKNLFKSVVKKEQYFYGVKIKEGSTWTTQFLK